MNSKMLISQSAFDAYVLGPKSVFNTGLEYVIRLDGEVVGSYDSREKCASAMKSILNAMHGLQEYIFVPANEPFTGKTNKTRWKT